MDATYFEFFKKNHRKRKDHNIQGHFMDSD